MHMQAETNKIASKNGRGKLRLLPSPSQADTAFAWDEDVRPAINYAALGQRLAEKGDLFRNPVQGGGLILVSPDGKHRAITRGSDLYPIIVDRVHVRLWKDGKSKGGRIPAADLNAMLLSESFLSQFRPLDLVTSVAMYLPPDFRLTDGGYNNCEEGHRIYYTGNKPPISDSMETIKKFLKAMAFKSNADQTNAVGAALTVMLRSHRAGGKPVILVTSTKSHGGKGTVVDFATGPSRSILVPYQSEDWAFERGIVEALRTAADLAVMVIDNARLGKGNKVIASASLERALTDPKPFFFSARSHDSIRIRNNIVFAITTNFGMVSEDIMNRALPIHLEPVGDVAARQSPIGNPKHEFLPENRAQIDAALRGMIERWKAAGMPLDMDVRHPFTLWARTIGGILKVNGFTDFLANYATRKTTDDPVRRGLGLLGAEHRNEWSPSSEWAALAVTLGVSKIVIPEADRENPASHARGIGVVLRAHAEETFEAETDAEKLTLRLEHRRGRWKGSPHNLWRFVEVSAEKLPEDDPPDDLPEPHTEFPQIQIETSEDEYVEDE